MANEGTKQMGNIGLPIGTKVGKYEVKERIAVGGQAIVYKCYDAMLDRHVAVKQISSHLAEDPKFLERFRREAQILAKLGTQQPAIATIYELVEDERGLFIVMEFISGPSLEQVLTDTPGPVEMRATLQILWRLAAALHDVHVAGIIHRDIKPANIIISEGLRPKITDFGVAASLSGQTSMLLGTTKYMAPELFAGGSVDGRADMYSLGFITYEMLVGRPKFQEIFADVVRDKHSESLRWMKWHGNEEVTAPPVNEVNAAVPAHLSAIIAKMMAKKADDRFRNMEELGYAIKTAFSPRAKPAAGAGKAAAPKPTRRHAMPQPAPGARTGAGAAAIARPKQSLPPDEGDDLIIAQDEMGPSTAVVPKKKMTLRTKLIALGSVVGVMIIALIAVLVHQSNQNQIAKNSAAGVYGAAEKSYLAGNYSGAITGLGELSKRFPDSVQADKASLLLHLCASRQAIAETQSDWKDVSAREREQAEGMIKSIQDKRPELTEWTRGFVRTELDNIKRQQNATWDFLVSYEDAKAAFEENKYPDCLEKIKKTLENRDLTTEQRAKLEDFRKQVVRKQFMTTVTDTIAAGDRANATANYEDAQKNWQAAQDLLSSDQAISLTSDEKDRMKADLLTKLKALGSAKELASAKKAVEDAKAAGNKQGEIDAIGKLVELTGPSREQTDRVNALQSDLCIEEGKKFRADGKIAEAKDAFNRSLKFKDNEIARNELADMEQSNQRQTLVNAGDAAFAAAKYDEALTKYGEAAKLKVDDAVNTKMTECRFKMQMAEADKLNAARKYDEAFAAYEKARAIKPDAGGEIDGILNTMKQRLQYEKAITDGDAEMKANQWAKARKLYTAAKAIIDSDEVKQRIAWTWYAEHISAGRAAMDRHDYGGALAYFKLAKGYVDKDDKKLAEIDGLIEEAAKLKKSQDSAEQPK